MKHIKLFESFNMGDTPAQLIVTGDWTGILKNPDKFAVPFDGQFIAPATFICEYMPAGSPIPSGYENVAGDLTSDLDGIAEEAFGGDQNGANVAPKDYSYLSSDKSGYANDLRQGVVRIFVDPSLDPSEIESYLKDHCSRIWGVGSDEEYYSISDYPADIFDPNYIKMTMSGKPFARKVIFTK